MPPKKQMTVDKIIEKAFEMVNKEGYEMLTARKLAKELDCSTQPIYQAFSDMNELKSELVRKAIDKMVTYIFEHSDKKLPADLASILAYVDFAKEEKFLFQLIVTSGYLNAEKIPALVPKEMKIDLDMIIYANGIVMMSAYKSFELSETNIRDMIINAYEKFKCN
jgi:AcrR family transcriptional regulator